MSPAEGRRGALTRLGPRLSLARILIMRDITGRYRGSVLGILWSLITPLLMLAVYTFVFRTVLDARWSETSTQTGTSGFAIILFAGLIVFQLFAEVVTRAPTLVLSNVSFAKRMVFPLEVLPAVALGSALFHAAVSLLMLLAFMLAVVGHVPLTALWLPLVLAPLLLVILGLGWMLASLGVYLRDIPQILGTIVTALLFLSPVFYHSSALPGWLRPWMVLNPLALPIEQVREVLIWGNPPDWTALGLYGLCAILIAALGYYWFEATRKGFADVL